MLASTYSCMLDPHCLPSSVTCTAASSPQVVVRAWHLCRTTYINPWLAGHPSSPCTWCVQLFRIQPCSYDNQLNLTLFNHCLQWHGSTVPSMRCMFFFQGTMRLWPLHKRLWSVSWAISMHLGLVLGPNENKESTVLILCADVIEENRLFCWVNQRINNLLRQIPILW